MTSSNGSMVSGNLCPQLLNLLQFPVPLENPLNASRSTALLQLLDLPLQVLNMFLRPLSDVPLRLSIVCALACQLGFAEVSDGPLTSTRTFGMLSVAVVEERGEEMHGRANLSSVVLLRLQE